MGVWGGENAWDLTGDRAQGGFASQALVLGWLAADLRFRFPADFGDCGSTLRVSVLHASCLIYPP